MSKAVWWAMIAVGLGLLTLLTTAPFWSLFGDARFRWFPEIGYYPKSLLGTDVERVSNAYPPTVCFHGRHLDDRSGDAARLRAATVAAGAASVEGDDSRSTA